MKTKIKNEFQNPDLIFGNENQKRKLKLKIDFYFWKKVIDKQKSMWYIDYRNKFKEDLKWKLFTILAKRLLWRLRLCDWILEVNNEYKNQKRNFKSYYIFSRNSTNCFNLFYWQWHTYSNDYLYHLWILVMCFCICKQKYIM